MWGSPRVGGPTSASQEPKGNGLGQLVGLPDLPPHFLPREDEVDALRQRLLSPLTNPLAITAPGKLAVRGMGGVGKSVLANAAARDIQVRQQFRDGMFWLTVGQDQAGQDAKAMALQAALCTCLGDAPSILSAQQGKEHLRRLLLQRACLIVLDDVWDIRDAQRLDVAGPRSRILLTTRDGSLVTDLGAEEYPLELLSEDQAAALLSDWSGKPAHEDPGAQAVARECGYLPLALAICGALARDGAAWDAIAAGLQAADLRFLKRRGIDPQYETVLKSIQASVEFLAATDPEAVDLYRSLAVFPSDESVPQGVVAMLWEQTAGCPSWRGDILLSTLERKSLLRLEGKSPRRRVSLHDLQHEYVRQTHPDLARLHHDVLEAYRGRCPAGWASGPDDGYFFQHLAAHLVTSNRGDELRGLLLDCQWLEAKLKATDVVQLLADYKPFAGNRALSLVRDALRLSAHHLARDPSLARGQLHGRLLGIASLKIQRLLGSAAGGPPWLRPLTPSLTRPGGELIQSLQGHADRVRAVAVTPDGTRAVSASWDTTLKVWDLGTGTLLATFATDYPLSCCAVARTGETLVAADQGGRVHIIRWESQYVRPAMVRAFLRVMRHLLTPN
ncbi:MAG TPA: NB-ARC domain-containing protein [Isosphaeraceae bacterium]